jgi:hypothetical protein
MFAEKAFQDLYILGEMSESKLNKVLRDASKRKKSE